MQSSLLIQIDARRNDDKCIGYTRPSRLKTGLLTTAVNSLVKMNGLQTRLTSALWSLDWHVWGAMLECYISTQAGEHRRAQDSSAVDVGPAVTGLDQQTPRKDSGLVRILVADISNIMVT